MRNRGGGIRFSLAVLCGLIAAAPAAADPVPGNSCAGKTANSFIQSGGPENGGVSNFMFCNGGTTQWAGIINFQSSGKIGINTTTPVSALDVKNSSGTSDIPAFRVYAEDTNASQRSVGMYAYSTNTGALIFPGAAKPAIASEEVGVVLSNYNGAEGGASLFRVTIATTSNTNTTPFSPDSFSDAFIVTNSGNALFATSGYLNFGTVEGTSGYGFRDSGGVMQRKNSGGSWATISTTSDQRLKRDIVPLPKEEGLASIMKLKPVRFHWKDAERNQTEGEQIGLIAQDVEKVYPTGDIVYNFGNVTMDLGDGKKEKIAQARGLNYEKLIPPLIAALQEQQMEIEYLRAEIDAMKAGKSD